MTFTPLFVELMVIGLGATIWIAIFFAAIFKYKFQSPPSLDNKLIAATLAAAVYVLGIVCDRQVRDFSMPVIEAHAKKEIFTPEKIIHIKTHYHDINEANISMELEKFIRAHSEPLASKIDYNRSRLRICRSWSLHFTLTAIAIAFWGFRTKVISLRRLLTLSICNLALAFLTLQTTLRLAEDHQKDLYESFNIIIDSKSLTKE